MFSGRLSCTRGLSDFDALMDGSCFVGVSEKMSRGCIHLHKVVFLETPSLEAEDGSCFTGVSKTATKEFHPFHPVMAAEVVLTEVCFATSSSSRATGSSNIRPELVKSMSVDKMVRMSKTFCFIPTSLRRGWGRGWGTTLPLYFI